MTWAAGRCLEITSQVGVGVRAYMAGCKAFG